MTESSDGDGRSPSGIGIVSRLGDGRYECPPLLCLECGGQTVSEPVIGIWVIRGVRGWRPPRAARELRPLLVAGGPYVGATSGMSSGVTSRVIGVYWPSAETRRRIEAESDDDGE